MAKKDKKNKAQESEVASALQQSQMGRYGVKTDSKRVKKREALIRVLVIVLIILILFLSIMFACSSYINKAGDFTVTMDKDAFNVGISLSETRDFKDPTRFLAGDKCEDMLECTYKWLPEDVDNIDGSHNRSNNKDFLAYTFYVKNSGKEEVGYEGHINVDSVALGADEALRVMVIENGERTIYAKPKKGTTNQFETNDAYSDDFKYDIDKLFVSDKRVMDTGNRRFKVGDIDKYTVVIWIEGEDPECVNEILKGEVKLSMDFSCYELDDSDGSAK